MKRCHCVIEKMFGYTFIKEKISFSNTNQQIETKMRIISCCNMVEQ